ncbi:hypothetical protein [Actinospica robiniae]|uniref:hypothetical protein n=1 Tax=Actinospica robiniae TaxID=304901 RepID=UPI000419B683|nr:hypothetical protein [Actinospica robiniae]
MTRLGRFPRAVSRWSARSLRDLRASHPVRVLRIMRNLMLAAVVSTLLLCFGTAVVAHHRISAAIQTERAMADVADAQSTVQKASNELYAAFHQGDPSLTGTGTAFGTDTAKAAQDLADAVRDSDAAGVRGEQELSFVQGQLQVCERLADAAVLEYAEVRDPDVVTSPTGCLTDHDQTTASGARLPDTGGLTAALLDLRQLEEETLTAQQTSFWLHPLRFVGLLLAPTIVMLALLIGTAGLLARHFRRFISPLLLAAAADSAIVAVVLSILSAADDGRLSANPWTAHPVTMAVEGVLLIGALLLIYFGYRPRLAEYRFRPR